MINSSIESEASTIVDSSDTKDAGSAALNPPVLVSPEVSLENCNGAGDLLETCSRIQVLSLAAIPSSHHPTVTVQ
jgi:hypothetical protein